MLDQQKIDRRFCRYLSDDQDVQSRLDKNTKAFQDFARFIDKKTPDGRLLSLVMTKLEEAYMYNSKAILLGGEVRELPSGGPKGKTSNLKG